MAEEVLSPTSRRKRQSLTTPANFVSVVNQDEDEDDAHEGSQGDGDGGDVDLGARPRRLSVASCTDLPSLLLEGAVEEGRRAFSTAKPWRERAEEKAITACSPKAQPRFQNMRQYLAQRSTIRRPLEKAQEAQEEGTTFRPSSATMHATRSGPKVAFAVATVDTFDIEATEVDCDRQAWINAHGETFLRCSSGDGIMPHFEFASGSVEEELVVGGFRED